MEVESNAIVFPPQLLAVSPGELTVAASVAPFLRCMRPLIAAGLEGLLLREPLATDRLLLEVAEALRSEGLGWLGIHDRAHLARAPYFDGVHLGFRSLPPRTVRNLVPAEIAVGFSAHAEDDLARVSADYVFLSPIFSPISKAPRFETPPIGLEALGEACKRKDRPRIWALGGIDRTNAGAVIDRGSDGIAVIGALFHSSDSALATAELLNAFR